MPFAKKKYRVVMHGSHDACKASLRSFRILHVKTIFGIKGEGLLHACISSILGHISCCSRSIVGSHYINKSASNHGTFIQQNGKKNRRVNDCVLYILNKERYLQNCAVESRGIGQCLPVSTFNTYKYKFGF